MHCKMDLRHFPLDTQHCSIAVSSYGFGYGDLQLRWWTVQGQGVLLDTDIELNEFGTPKLSMHNCTDKSLITGWFTCLRVDLELQRQIGERSPLAPSTTGSITA